MNDDFIKSTKRKFFFYTGLGAFLILFISIVGFKFQSSIMQKEKNNQELYTKLEKQILLVNKVSSLSEKFEDYISKQKKEELRGEFLILLKELEDYNLELNKWLKQNRSFLTTQDIKNSIKKNDLKNHIEIYLIKARKIVKQGSPSHKMTKENIRYLSQISRGGLRKVFEELNEKIIKAQSVSLNKVRNMGAILVSLCILQVILVWLFVFRPLYSTIICQHEKVAESLLEANSANRSKTDFLANISHEIRTPMTAIMGYANLLNEESLDKKTKAEAAEIINRNASHLLELIDEILDVSKMESGKFDFEREKVNLSSTLSDLFSLINVKAEEKDIDLTLISSGNIPKFIYVDQKRFKQILFNIIGNAIKFTDEGFVEVTVDYNIDSQKLRLRVRDTGCGISQKEMSSLFKPFEQGDSSVNRLYGGSGLGLVLSRGMARRMGGDVVVIDTKLNLGTTIDVYLNIGTDNPELVDHLSTHVIVEAETELDLLNAESTLEGLNVLVVDDARENARLFKFYLDGATASTMVANDGFEAIDLVKQHDNFDLVLLDLQMPGKDGFQVIKELREYGFTKPVVALTAHAMNEEKIKTKKAGFDGHITKPVKPEVLIGSVKFYTDQYLRLES